MSYSLEEYNQSGCFNPTLLSAYQSPNELNNTVMEAPLKIVKIRRANILFL